MAYRAEIEIGVRGTRELERLRSLITQSTQAFESLNRIAAKRGGLNQTLSNYETQLTRAKRAIDNVTAGTQAEVKAIREYVTAMGLANAARDRQNYLIAQEIANRRKVQATINAGFGQQGPALPPAAVRRAGGGPAATLGGGRLGGIVGNAVIGGAFPLLFGQGGAAATGGALGGLLGGAFGGAGGFAGSLLGTLLGQSAGQANQVKELAADIGFSAQQTQLLGTAFKQAGADFDKFAESVSRIQGIGLALEEQASAIQLASTLTESYGGKIDKITNAFTNALQTGKVTQATLNQLTSQGIPIQDALANKYNVSRSALLQMAKDGKISVQDLLDTLVNLANESAKGAPKLQSAYDVAFKEISTKLQTLAGDVAAAFSDNANDINTSFDYVVQKSSSSFSKIIDALSPLTVKIAELVSNLIDVGTQAAVALLSIPNYAETAANGILLMIPGLRSVVDLLGTINAFRGGGKTSTGQDTGMYGRYIPGSQQQAIKSPIARISAPAQMAASGNKGKADKAANDAAREAERVAKLLRDTQAQTELLGIQAGLQDKIFQAEQAKDPLLVARLQGEERILEIQAKYAESIANEPNIRAQEALITKGLQEIENSRLQTAQAIEKIESDRKTRVEELLTNLNREIELNNIKDEKAKTLKQIEFDIIDLRKQGILLTEQEIEAYRQRAQAVANAANKLTAQQKMEQELFEGLASTFAGTVTSAFDAAVSGTENFGVALQELGGKLLSTISQMLIMYSIAQALGALGGGASNPQGIFSFLARAFGYQGKANGGPVAGGTPYLVGERGPELFVPGTSGGIMSNNDLRQSMNGGGSPVLNMSFQTTRFGDTEYVSRDQLEAAMAETRRQASRDGAQRGMTMTLDRLQQSPRTRSRLGMR